jgi:hypothetical protein
MEQNLCVLGYTVEDSFVAWDTTEEKLFQCGIQWEKTFALWDVLWCIPHRGKNLFHCIRNGKKPLLLVPKTEENLFRCIPHQKKNLKTKITERK